MMLSLMSRRSFSFVKKMAENIMLNTERAQRVQTNTLNQKYSIQQQAKLRQRVTVQSSVDNLEKQLRKQIAQALRRSEGKVQYLIMKAGQIYEKHRRDPLSKKEIEQYNNLVKECEKARWEYLVHRHSCGFTIKNHEIVMGRFPLPPKIQ